MKHKSKSYIFCFVAFVMLFSIAYTVGLSLGKDDSGTTLSKVDSVVEVEETTTAKEKTNGYWIRNENNYIVVYNYKGEFLVNTEISVENFTESEIRILNDGVYVETAQELFRCLESYTS